MRPLRFAFGLALGGLALPCATAETDFLTIASTTSTDHSGLYEHLLPVYEKKTGVRFRVVAVGTGQAIRNAMRGDADLLIVHHRESEERFVAEGYGLERRDLMYNEFVLVGPREDPAKVSEADDIAEALRRVSRSGLTFVSRGDDSGTHKRELEIWAKAEVRVRPASGDWYWEAGAGMGPTLNMAAARNAYVLSDGATWAAFGNRQDLVVLYRDDPLLHNQYGIIVVNPDRHSHVKWERARAFSDWLLSEDGQRMIAEFRIGGEQVFFPNARPR